MKTNDDSTRKVTATRVGEPNLDPITGEPGAHPVGTGLGAAGGGAAGAAMGAPGGPVGVVVGTIVGAVVGGLTGKGIAEAIDPTLEEAYWRENHARQPFAKGRGYNEFERAYRTGITGYASERSFEEREAELRAAYENPSNDQLEKGPGEAADKRLEWEEARSATRAAYDRLGKRKVAETQGSAEPVPVAP